MSIAGGAAFPYNRNVSLDQIRYFVSVAEEGAVRRAAMRLHVSQPPLTRALQALEGELGTQLLVRSRRGVQLSPAGHRFLGHARRILAEVEAARSVALEPPSSDGAGAVWADSSPGRVTGR
jgi:DNA-binding transcriptional LysR family regulator